LSNLTLKKLNSDLKFVYSDNNSISVIFQSNDLLLGVVGEFNSNLQELEKLTNTNLYFRGNSIIIKSNEKKNEIIKNAIQFWLSNLLIMDQLKKKIYFHQ
jgi:phosphate starvation-inducible PhoH-like protein